MFPLGSINYAGRVSAVRGLGFLGKCVAESFGRCIGKLVLAQISPRHFGVSAVNPANSSTLAKSTVTSRRVLAGWFGNRFCDAPRFSYGNNHARIAKTRHPVNS